MGRRKNNPELVEELVNTLYDHVYTNSKEDDEIAEKYWSLSSGDMKRLEKKLGDRYAEKWGVSDLPDIDEDSMDF